jgi:hypothetical protein
MNKSDFEKPLQESSEAQVSVGDMNEFHWIFDNGILWDVKISKRKSSIVPN